MTGSFEESVDFRMREEFDDPEAVRLALTGELDLGVAEMLGDRLRMLRTRDAPCAWISASSSSSIAVACVS
jgi:hypothetical protein